MRVCDGMKQSFWFAASVQARAGDLVRVFITAPSERSGLSRWLGLARQMNASRSPFIYNETSKAWFMANHHARITDEMVLAPREAPRVYQSSPDPDLPVIRVVHGKVLGSAVIRKISSEDSGVDSRLDLEILSERSIAPGEPWLPDEE
ncbi:hypothetical protein GCM10009434_22720 [Brevundimonas olei]